MIYSSLPLLARPGLIIGLQCGPFIGQASLDLTLTQKVSQLESLWGLSRADITRVSLYAPSIVTTPPQVLGQPSPLLHPPLTHSFISSLADVGAPVALPERHPGDAGR